MLLGLSFLDWTTFILVYDGIFPTISFDADFGYLHHSKSLSVFYKFLDTWMLIYFATLPL